MSDLQPPQLSSTSSVETVPALTAAEVRRLHQAIQQVDAGAFSAEWPLIRPGRERASLTRTCDSLCTKGLLKPYAHGGWEPTTLGRQVASSMNPKPY